MGRSMTRARRLAWAGALVLSPGRRPSPHRWSWRSSRARSPTKRERRSTASPFASVIWSVARIPRSRATRPGSSTAVGCGRSIIEMTVEKEGYQPINDKIRLTTASERRFDFKLAKASPAGSGEFAKATAAYNAGDFAGAAKLFEEVLAKSPNQPEARINLALAYLRLNKPAEAVAQLEQVAAGGNTDPRVQFQLGGAYVDMKELDKAVDGIRDRARAAAGREGSGRVGGGGHPRRRVLRQGRRRQGGGVVREGAGGASRHGRADARPRQGVREQGRRPEGVGAVRQGRRRPPRHAGSRTGGGVHQGAAQVDGGDRR